MSSATAATAQAAPQAFRPPNLALTTVGLALASFMQVLDTTIANVSLPTPPDAPSCWSALTSTPPRRSAPTPRATARRWPSWRP